MSTTATSWIVEAEIMPKRGVNDPQGDAVLSGLKLMGFSAAERVRVGKLIRLEIAASSEADALDQGRQMCEKLLANPVIEDFDVRVCESGGER